MPEKSISRKKQLLTWLCRLIAGGVFVFSGFAKGIDPWGTFYMMEDYLAVWGWNIPDPVVLFGAFSLIIIEFLIGFCVLFGCFRRGTPVLMMAMMAFMLPLTLWIAIKNPVNDCGCFGEALIISNTATFWKNVALTIMALWLVKFNRFIPSLIKPYFQWIQLLGTVTFIFIISFVGYSYQPLLDFRPYKCGTLLFSENDDSDNVPEFEFIYEKNGKRTSFSINDELPDEADGWKFIERKEILSSKQTANDNSEKNIRIWDDSGEVDITDEFMSSEGKRMFLMIPELKKVSTATTWQINSLNQWCHNNDIEMVAVVSGNQEEIDQWKDISLAEYPIYMADDTIIKEVVRGNPALVYTENGNIIWKSTLKALNVADFLNNYEVKDAKLLGRDNIRILKNLSLIFLVFTACMIAISYSPSIAKMMTNRAVSKSSLHKQD